MMMMTVTIAIYKPGRLVGIHRISYWDSYVIHRENFLFWKQCGDVIFILILLFYLRAPTLSSPHHDSSLRSIGLYVLESHREFLTG